MLLAETGRRAEAVPISQEAVDLRRELAAVNRAAYLPELAASLNNHAGLLAETGRQAEAVPISQQAVDLYAELAALNRAAHLIGYIQSVATLGLVLVEGARPIESITPLVEAFTLSQQVPERARSILDFVVGLLRRAYAEDPVGVDKEFRAIWDQGVPDWMAESPARPE